MTFLKSIKFRLTVWYLVVIVALLLVFGGVAYFMLSYSLYQSLDVSLESRGAELRTVLQAGGGRAVFVERLGEVVLLFDSSGNLLQGFGPQVEFAGIDKFVAEAASGEEAFTLASTVDGQRVRLFGDSFVVGPTAHITLVIGRPVSEIASALETFRFILLVVGVSVLTLAGAGGLFLSGRALKPVDRMTRTAQEIGESDLSKRIAAVGDDELGRLASTLNRMIERLEGALNRQRRFTADASHELRTPLAVMQAEATLSLSKPRSDAEYRRSLESVAQEASYMSSIIGKLLFLARSDTGKEPLNIEQVNLRDLLAGLSSDIEALGREKGLEMKLGLLEDLVVQGDRVRLRQLFLNIMDNAVRYTPSGGSMSVSVVRKDGMAVVAVGDTGIGIPAEHLPHVFERFYRVDKARSRAEGGAGLGLAIARHVAEEHGGRIEATSEPGKGSTFYVSLPVSDLPDREVP